MQRCDSTGLIDLMTLKLTTLQNLPAHSRNTRSPQHSGSGLAAAGSRKRLKITDSHAEHASIKRPRPSSPEEAPDGSRLEQNHKTNEVRSDV